MAAQHRHSYRVIKDDTQLQRAGLSVRRSGIAALVWTLGAAVFAFAAGLDSTSAEAARKKPSINLVSMSTKISPKLSAKRLVSFAKGHKVINLRETSHKKLEDREWRANAVVDFSQALGDLEYHIIISSLETGRPVFIKDLTVFVSSKTDSVNLTQIRLPRSDKDFKVNKPIHLAVKVRGRTIAETKVGLVGQAVKHSGKVDFTDAEARGR